jgi:hypothetical protein
MLAGLINFKIDKRYLEENGGKQGIHQQTQLRACAQPV